MDTIDKGSFDDTNKMFLPPKEFNFRIKSKDSDYYLIKTVHDLMEYVF